MDISKESNSFVAVVRKSDLRSSLDAGLLMADMLLVRKADMRRWSYY